MIHHRTLSGMAAWLRGFAPWLLLLALLVRGLIPGGFMPNINGDEGQGWLVICTASGMKTIDGHADGLGSKDATGPVDTHQPGLCAFALMAAVAPLLLLVALLLPLLLSRRVGRVRRADILPASLLLCRPPGARAPPAFA